MAHIIDSRLFGHLFGTDELRELFSDERVVRRWLEVEAALARAQAHLGLIPDEAAEAITTTAAEFLIDLARLRDGISETGHPLMPFVEAFARACPDDSGNYVHWGATTQDIMDTATVLQLRETLVILRARLAQLTDALVELALEHKGTPIAGRTHGQHALPVTFGFKVAVVLSELVRHRQRLDELQPRVLVIELSGGAGTLASLHPHGRAVQERVAVELGLGLPPIAWHSSRDAFAEFVFVCSMLGATCAKLAGEIVLLQKTEVGELAEPSTELSIGSSTMPQKRNPMLCEAIVALGRLLAQQPALALGSMVHQHERDMSAWQAEWEFLPETAILVVGSVELTTRVVEGLVVDSEAMLMNLARTGGLINAEAVMMALAPSVGRQRAHELVGHAARASAVTGEPFLACLANDEEIALRLDPEAIGHLLEPTSYLGDSEAAVERVVALLREVND